MNIRGKIQWTSEMLAKISAEYPYSYNKELAAELGIGWRTLVRNATIDEELLRIKNDLPRKTKLNLSKNHYSMKKENEAAKTHRQRMKEAKARLKSHISPKNSDYTYKVSIGSSVYLTNSITRYRQLLARKENQSPDPLMRLKRMKF